MQKVVSMLENFFKHVENQGIGLSGWIMTFGGIIFLRLFLDNFIAKKGPLFLLGSMDIHNFLFFLMTILIIWLILAFITRKKPTDFSVLMLWAALLFIFPPVFDLLKTGGNGVFWSSYIIEGISGLWRQLYTVFGDFPSGIIYFGTKITFISAILLGGLFVYNITKSWKKALVSVFFVYLGLFFVAALPSFFAIGFVALLGNLDLFSISAVDVFQLVGSPTAIFGLKKAGMSSALAYNLNLIYFPLLVFLAAFLLFASDKAKFWAILQNIRLPQIFFHSGLFFVGLGLGFLAYPENFQLNIFSLTAVAVLLLSIWFSWIASVVANDIVDRRIDAVTNSNRPLLKGAFSEEAYRDLGVAFFILALVGGLIISDKVMFLLLTYQIIAWFYSMPPFRLKRVPVLATLLSAVALLTVLFLGYIVFSGEQNISRLSWRIIFMLLFCYTLALPIKDFKDIEGDKKDGVWTIPVIFGEKNGRLIVASGIFVCFVSSVIFLNEARLFWWSNFFGALSFWIVLTKKPHQLFWWVLIPVSAYGLVVVKLLFF